MSLAPIVLFVYNRPWHTRKTVKALKNNELARESELFIFSDAAKNHSAKNSVDEVRSYIRKINGFKKITIVEREKNWGLANSIIDGVTTIVNQFGKVIVLEDDLVTSPFFLKFMNDALDFYQNKAKVWHISGWNYPIDVDGLNDVYFLRIMNCWGWATWADRWRFYEKNTSKIVKEFSKERIRYLNLDGYNESWEQVKLNKNKKINTWAIYWYATIVKNDALCLNPAISYIDNIGHDNSGVHCGSTDIYRCNCQAITDAKFINHIEENSLAINRIKKFYFSNKKTVFNKIAKKIKRTIDAWLCKKNI